jgi:photosystem II stability/assembly factor-like uncharacterized protein
VPGSGPSLVRFGSPGPPRYPRGLFHEARRRRHRRWLAGASVVLLVAAGSGIGAAWLSTGPVPGTALRAPSGGGGATLPATPAIGATGLAASPRLATLAFFNPTKGYGLFTAGTSRGCQVEVGATLDGGATFGPLVEVGKCTAIENGSLAFDDHGDGFLFTASSQDLYVTHDAGAGWNVSRQPGDVLSVEALGYSVWMLQAECPATLSTAPRACRLAVRESTDGGRSWRTSPAQPSPAPTYRTDQGSLVRLSQSAAYVLGDPATHADGDPLSVPLWYTSDSGASWTLRHVSCGIAATSARMSAAPTGTLFAVCAGQRGAGSQMKSVVVSTNGGMTWLRPGACEAGAGAQCPTQGLSGGYLASVDAVSSTTAYIDEARGDVVETTDAGVSWAGIGPTAADTGTTTMAFFNAVDGLVWAGSTAAGADQLWHTVDGGATWSPVSPKLGTGTTAPYPLSGTGQISLSADRLRAV